MKVRNYEKKELITFLVLVVLIVEVIVIVFLNTFKINEYSKITGLVIKKDLVLVVVDKEERKIVYSNKTLFFNDFKRKYKIIEDRGIVMHKGNKDYYQLVLKFPFKNKKIKTNDVMNLVFIKGRILLIKIFKIIWEGD